MPIKLTWGVSKKLDCVASYQGKNQTRALLRTHLNTTQSNFPSHILLPRQKFQKLESLASKSFLSDSKKFPAAKISPVGFNVAISGSSVQLYHSKHEINGS